MVDSTIRGQCPAVRWSSDAAHFSPTLCVLKIIVLKPQNKNSYKGPLRNSTGNIVPEASLVVVAIIMNDPTEERPQGKGREGKLEELAAVPFHVEILLCVTVLKDVGLVFVIV